MDYRRFGDTLIVRIDKNEEVVEQLKKVAEKENIQLASVSALGAINDFSVGVFDTQNRTVSSPRTFRRCSTAWIS